MPRSPFLTSCRPALFLTSYPNAEATATPTSIPTPTPTLTVTLTELQLSAGDVPAVVKRGRAADVPLLQQAA